MKNNASAVFSFFLIIGDAIALTAAFSAAYILRVKFDPRPLVEQIPAFTFLHAFLAILPLWILVHIVIGLYSQDIYEKRFSELGRLFIGSFLGILVVIGYDFINPDNLFPARLVPVYALGLGFGFLLITRSIMRALRRLLFRYNIGTTDVLIIGNTPVSEELADAVSDTTHTGFRVIGLVGRRSDEFAHFSSFKDFVANGNLPHGIVQTELYKDQERNNEILRFAQERHISYRFIPGNSDMFVGNITVELFAGLPVIAVHQTALIGWGRIIKRLFDIIASVMLIVILSPFMFFAALLIKIFDPSGPVFFRQSRLTRFNREFKVFKFRSFKQRYCGPSDEESFEIMGRPDLYEEYKKNGYKLDHDPRHTPVGRFLRKTTLDEIPQLFNVLKGDISLVGPRALIPKELNSYEKKHAILSVKSGMTGLAQISGRQDISFEERRKIDMYYVQNWSFWLDISILIRTLRVVITGSGAK